MKLDMLQPVDSLEDVARNARRDRAISNCKRKAKFRSRSAARNWVIERQGRGDWSAPKQLKPYHCNVCSKWHLTSKT